MKVLKKFIVLSIVMSLLVSPVTVYAYPQQAESVHIEVLDKALDAVTDPTGTFIQAYHFPGVYRVGGCFATAAEAEQSAEYLSSNIFPASSFLTFQMTQDVNGFTATTNGDDITRAKETQLLANAWCAQNLQNIVPSGKSLDEAIVLCANYLAKHTTYMKPNESVPAAYRLGVSALPVLYYGQGWCSHYTAAFNTMIAYLPFNEGGVVDWASVNPIHQQVMPIHIPEQIHVISGVWQNGKWRRIDTSSYDVLGGSSYLNM